MFSSPLPVGEEFVGEAAKAGQAEVSDRSTDEPAPPAGTFRAGARMRARVAVRRRQGGSSECPLASAAGRASEAIARARSHVAEGRPADAISSYIMAMMACEGIGAGACRFGAQESFRTLATCFVRAAVGLAEARLRDDPDLSMDLCVRALRVWGAVTDGEPEVPLPAGAAAVAVRCCLAHGMPSCAVRAAERAAPGRDRSACDVELGRAEGRAAAAALARSALPASGSSAIAIASCAASGCPGTAASALDVASAEAEGCLLDPTGGRGAAAARAWTVWGRAAAQLSEVPRSRGWEAAACALAAAVELQAGGEAEAAAARLSPLVRERWGGDEDAAAAAEAGTGSSLEAAAAVLLCRCRLDGLSDSPHGDSVARAGEWWSRRGGRAAVSRLRSDCSSALTRAAARSGAPRDGAWVGRAAAMAARTVCASGPAVAAASALSEGCERAWQAVSDDADRLHACGEALTQAAGGGDGDAPGRLGPWDEAEGRAAAPWSGVVLAAAAAGTLGLAAAAAREIAAGAGAAGSGPACRSWALTAAALRPRSFRSPLLLARAEEAAGRPGAAMAACRSGLLGPPAPFALRGGRMEGIVLPALESAVEPVAAGGAGVDGPASARVLAAAASLPPARGNAVREVLCLAADLADAAARARERPRRVEPAAEAGAAPCRDGRGGRGDAGEGDEETPRAQGAATCEGADDTSEAITGSHYHTIGVGPRAAAAQIRSAYRRLARALHPDKVRASGASEADVAEAEGRFKDVAAAYEVLSDSDARAVYDAQYAEAAKAAAARRRDQARRGAGPGRPAESLFRTSDGAGRRRRYKARRRAGNRYFGFDGSGMN